jgi:hypothetical protein
LPLALAGDSAPVAVRLRLGEKPAWTVGKNAPFAANVSSCAWRSAALVDSIVGLARQQIPHR